MTEQYKQEAERMLTESNMFNQQIEGGKLTPSQMEIDKMARLLAEHDAKLLENSAAEYKAGLFSFPLQSYLYRRAAQIRKEAGL